MQNLFNRSGQQTPIVRARYDFLKSEIARWQEENILDRAQADEILARYSSDGGLQHGLKVLIIASACAVGCAVLLFISANWPGVSYQSKCMAVVAAMLACYIFGWRLKNQSQLKTILSELLVFLGCVFFGGATNLVAQHFQITGNQPELLIWAMGIAPLVIIFRSHPAAILMSMIVCYRSFSFSGNSFDWFTLLAAGSSLFCTYYIRSPWGLVCNLISIVAMVSICKPRVDEFAVLFFGISCFILHLWHEHSKRWQMMSLTYLLASMAFVFLAILGLENEYSYQSLLERTSIQKIQLYAVTSLILLSTLLKSPAGKTCWSSFTGFNIICAVVFSCFCLDDHSRFAGVCGFLAANLFYLFYFTSTIENRIIQFIPVATLTIFSLICFAAAPGGALIGSSIAFGVGLVLMICSFAALGRSFSTRAPSERNLEKTTQ